MTRPGLPVPRRRGLTAAAAAVLALLILGAVLITTLDTGAPAAPANDPPAAGHVAPAPVPIPTSVRIPSLGITDEVVPVGLTAEQELAVPAVTEVGWYDGSPAPGAVGPALLIGHVNYDGQVGSFARIGDLTTAAVIEVGRADGTVATFEVVDVVQAPKAQFPTQLVYGDTADEQLRLVTCSGRLVDHSYTDNTIVTARLRR